LDRLSLKKNLYFSPSLEISRDFTASAIARHGGHDSGEI
jgi:hypothetical protein